MFAFIYSFTLLFAATGGSGEGGFSEFWNTYLNYPGFEIWKFVNLAIFVGIIGYLVKKPLSEAFKKRREVIRAELIRAEEEKQAALERLTAVEARLATLEAEKNDIIAKAKADSEAEKKRLIEEAEAEAARMRQQTGGELVRLSQVAKIELRKFSIEESIRRAEEKLRSQIDEDKDTALVRSSIEAIGGLN